jgi:hypothetical protein
MHDEYRFSSFISSWIIEQSSLQWEVSNIYSFWWSHWVCDNQCKNSIHRLTFWRIRWVMRKISVAAGLGFGHVEQPDPIQSSGWTRISVQLSGLNKDFCPNPRKLYVTGSVSSSSGCPTRGLGWRICPTRGSGLNFCPKPNPTARLRKMQNSTR